MHAPYDSPTLAQPARNCWLYLLLTVLVIPLGLASRRYGTYLPPFLAEYTGDTLYATMLFLLGGLLFPRLPTRQLALGSLALCYLIEISQLYHAPWIDAIRHTTLGGLILGFAFLWSDLACYTVGVLLGVGIDLLVFRKR